MTLRPSHCYLPKEQVWKCVQGGELLHKLLMTYIRSGIAHLAELGHRAEPGRCTHVGRLSQSTQWATIGQSAQPFQAQSL